MKLVSWNVNGIRAASRKGFNTWLAETKPDILCLQETRIQPEQLSPRMKHPIGYHTYWNSAERKGYSGVATFTTNQPLSVRHGFGQPEFDIEGRVLVTEHPAFTLLNVYFPNGRRSQERVAYKIEFYDQLLGFCSSIRDEGKQLIVCGDYNTAHQPIDLARPTENRNTSGFLPEERQALDRWLESGFVDIFRYMNPESQEYTWWTYRYNARQRNIGWRIDYFLITRSLVSAVHGALILGDVLGSDHCPIALTLNI